MHIVERTVNGKSYYIETGRIAKQAQGSALVRCGETIVLVSACVGEDKGGDFLPLTIDYIEKTYAGGKIPGGFFKREGKLSEREILVSRLIDRPCRPLFPEGFGKEIQVVATVLSADGEHDPDMLALLGASSALSIADIPFEGPVAGVRVVRVKGQLLINPSASESSGADLSFIVAGSKDAIVMVEGGADQVSEDEVVEALFFAHREMQPLIDMQNELVAQLNSKKTAFVAPPIFGGLLGSNTDSGSAVITESDVESLRKSLRPELDKAVQVSEKAARRDSIRTVRETTQKNFLHSLVNVTQENREVLAKAFNKLFEDELFESVRSLAFDKKLRLDGRDFFTVRPINIELGFLPRTHGSSLFTRGETQAIVVTTLGTEQEAQKLDNLVGETEKTFLLHYNFPGYSVGEVKPLRGPGRREIGHGALAERAIKAVIPSAKEFPYVIRVVSEITESNGSSSMATVCGASLALMDAGVPIKAPVAGVAMGLMVRGSDEFVVLTDILGDEDHLGDMDFKVCGTSVGITALQMDIKIKGLARGVVEVALHQAKTARLHILAKMSEVVNVPRSSLSKYAPRIETIRISVDKIRDVIGPGGKTIRSITESCGVKIDISDDGIVRIASSSATGINEARSIIENLTREAEVGKLYRGVVKRIVDFGAFVEIIPGTEGLVHISQLEEGRVNRVSDVVQEGESIWVKVLEIDRSTGKVRLSRKEALVDVEKQGLQ